MKCQKCEKSALEIKGWLERVNEKGVPGIWECRPGCDTIVSQGQALTGALTGSIPDPNGVIE